MTDIELRNENGKIVGYDNEGDKIPVSFDSVDTDEATIGSTPRSRPAVTNSDTSVSVPTDYETVQDALNDIPILVRHRYDINLENGTFDEDVIVPPFIHGVNSAITAEMGTLKILGDSATPSNVEVGSVYTAGGVGLRGVRLEGFTVLRDNPHGNEDVAIGCYGRGSSVYLDSLRFDGSGNITNGILAYNTLVRAEIDVDLGSNNVSNNGVFVKQSGRYEEQKAKTAIKGNVGGHAYQVQSGEAYITSDTSTLTGDKGQYDILKGRAYDIDQRKAIGLQGLSHENTKFAASNVKVHQLNPNDATKVQLLPTANPTGAVVSVADHSLGVAALFHLAESTSATKIGGTADFTTTEGNAGTTNVYWDGTNVRFELENNTGAQRDYGIVRLS